MRKLILVALYLGFFLGVFDTASFDGGYRTATWQWAKDQGSEVRYGVRRLVDRTFGE